jgi:predicted ATPase
VDESADAEHHARPGDILLTAGIHECLRDTIETLPSVSHWRFRGYKVDMPDPQPVILPPVDLDIARLFMPEEVIAHDVRGEFRQVVNLFMRFPDLSESELDGMMHRVFELRNKYGGLVSRMDFGDKGCNMLMLWGAPVAYGNDIGRALNFLLDLKSSADFPITAGVTYYISHAGYLGSSIFEDYTCYGWGVNLASRFMMSAPAGEIWVDERIARRVSNWFEIEFLNSQSFKGFAARQKVYTLYRHKPTAEPTYQGELVGREEEFARLVNFIQPLWEKKFAGLLLVSGDAGIGKGRLVHEVRSSRQFESRNVLWAVCQADQIQRQSFNPLRNWLLRYFGMSAAQPLEERKQSFDRKLDELLGATSDLPLAYELERTRSVLGALLDLSWPGSLYEQLDPEGRYNNTFLALIALLKAESLRRPVILFIEDLQFVDRDTRDFLARLKRTILAGTQAFPIAMIVTSRRQGASLEKDLIDVRLPLRGLSHDALGHLLETLLGGPVAAELVSLVMERSEGNPYFAEQIVHYLQEGNLVESGKLGWTPVKTLDDDFLPGDVQAVLVARLDQLERGVRDSVQTASVLGRQFEIPVLTQMLRGEGQVDRKIAEAEKAAVWTPLDEIRYVFTHGLLRDAAYEMQMRARRKELHALAVDALEHLYGEEKNRYAEIAHHAKYAELSSKAQRYYMLAGKTAADSYQNHQAIEYYKRALAFTPLDDLKTQFDILLERVELFNRIGNRPAQRKDLETLESLAGQRNDQRCAMKVGMLFAHYYIAISDYPSVVWRSEQVIELSHLVEEPQAVLDTYRVWPLALLRQGKLKEAMHIAEEGRKLAQSRGELSREGYILVAMGLIAIEQKDPSMGQTYFAQALFLAKETNDRRLESIIFSNLGNLAGVIQQDYVSAREYYEAGYVLIHERGERSAECAVLGNLGWISGQMADFHTARSYLERSLAIARETGNPYVETNALINLSAVAGALNDAQASLSYAREALELSRKAKDRSSEAWSLLYAGHAHLSLGDLQQAEEAFRQSTAIREELAQPSLKTEPVAGLIETLLRRESPAAALGETERVLAFLENGGTLEGTEEPLRVYLACYLALEKTKDPRARHLLQSAVQLLEAQVSKLQDEGSRQRFVENVSWRAAIRQAWQDRSE